MMIMVTSVLMIMMNLYSSVCMCVGEITCYDCTGLAKCSTPYKLNLRKTHHIFPSHDMDTVNTSRPLDKPRIHSPRKQHSTCRPECACVCVWPRTLCVLGERGSGTAGWH